MRNLLLILLLLTFTSAAYSAQTEVSPALQQAIDRGDDYLSDDKFDQAISEFRHAVQSYPESSVAHQRLAQAYSLEGRLEEALSEETRAIELDPQNAAAHSNLAWLMGIRKQYRAAAREAAVALKLDPTDVSAYLSLGLAQASLGDFDGAISANEKAIELEPDNVKAHINLGGSLGRKGDYAGAIAVYKKALAIKPNSLAAHLGLGDAMGKVGLRDEQIKQFQIATSLAPHSDSAHGKLGWALYHKGDLQGALKEGCITNWIRLQKSGPAYLRYMLNLWAAVFLLFGLIFAVIFIGSRFTPELGVSVEQGEFVLKTFFLVFHDDKPGRFVVTNKRIIFVPEWFSRWFGSKALAFPKDQVKKMEAITEGRTKMLSFRLSDDTMHKFSMPNLVLKPLSAYLTKPRDTRTTSQFSIPWTEKYLDLDEPSAPTASAQKVQGGTSGVYAVGSPKKEEAASSEKTDAVKSAVDTEKQNATAPDESARADQVKVESAEVIADQPKVEPPVVPSKKPKKKKAKKPADTEVKPESAPEDGGKEKPAN